MRAIQATDSLHAHIDRHRAVGGQEAASITGTDLSPAYPWIQSHRARVLRPPDMSFIATGRKFYRHWT